MKKEEKEKMAELMIAEQKIRTQRILGQLIREGQERGEIASRERDMGNQYKVLSSEGEHSKPLTLPSLTITL